MSYTSIPNQPLIFSSQLPEQCEGCNSEYAQLMDFNEQVFWQLNTDTCGSLQFAAEELVGDWTQDGGEVTAYGGIGGYLVGYDRYDIVLNYEVTITINQYNSGTLVAAIFPTGSFIYLNSVGTHTIYLNTPDVTSNSIVFSFTGLAGDYFDGTFTIQSIKPMPTGALFAGIVDATTLAVVERLDPTLIVKDNYLTAAIDLSDYELEAGCYRLAIADYCTNTCGQYYIYNPFFNTRPFNTGWASNPIVGTTDWVVGGGEASIELSGTNSTELISITELCEDKDYYVSIVVDTINGCTLELRVNGITYGSTITTAGTYNFTITPSSSGAVSLVGTSISGSRNEIVITKISVRIDKNWAVYDKYSDLISIGDYSDPCRFFKLEGCNGEDQFGLSFYGSSFLPSIRLEGRRFQPQYETDADLFRYSSGRWSSTYVDRKKKVSFYFGRLPEYVFDFLSILFYFDNCYINGVLHTPVESEFPTIEYDNADDLGAFTIEMYKQNDLVKKTICIGVDADCLPSILDNQDEPFILTQDSQRITTQDLINLYQE